MKSKVKNTDYVQDALPLIKWLQISSFFRSIVIYSFLIANNVSAKRTHLRLFYSTETRQIFKFNIACFPFL